MLALWRRTSHSSAVQEYKTPKKRKATTRNTCTYIQLNNPTCYILSFSSALPARSLADTTQPNYKTTSQVGGCVSRASQTTEGSISRWLSSNRWVQKNDDEDPEWAQERVYAVSMRTFEMAAEGKKDTHT